MCSSDLLEFFHKKYSHLMLKSGAGSGHHFAPTFGGINLEDISAPECFEIERRLVEELDIPVMHDDQHGTAIISGAALLNGLEVVSKKIGDVKVVILGAGASAISCAKHYVRLGVKLENLIMLDSKGIMTSKRMAGCG